MSRLLEASVYHNGTYVDGGEFYVSCSRGEVATEAVKMARRHNPLIAVNGGAWTVDVIEAGVCYSFMVAVETTFIATEVTDE